MNRTVRKRIEHLERKQLEKAGHHHEMTMRCQKWLGLPLPAGADTKEALRRLKSALRVGTADAMDGFREWVRLEKERITTISQEGNQ